MPFALLMNVDMSLAMDDQSPSNGSASLLTPTSDQLNRQTSLDDKGDVRRNGSEDSGGSDADGINDHRAKKPRISHACQACRRMKIRCEPLDDQNSCKQCTKTSRECLITAPRRKRQKTVHRVAELEKKIEALTASLGSKECQENPTDAIDPSLSPSLVPTYLTSNDEVRAHELNASLAQAISDAVDAIPSVQKTWTNDAPCLDVIESGLVDEATAYRAFYRFHTEMCIHFPVVVFPPATTAQEIRSKRPILFLSILAAGIGEFQPGMQSTLADELTFILANRVMYRGERSLEMVQALLVLMSFYTRPKHQRELNFNQIIHVAATMALDLGMGRRSKQGVFNEKPMFPGVSVVETRRTWLGCYYMCANAAMSLRHPIFIRWSPYMDESVELLSSSTDALPTDIWLCDLVRLQHIGEEVAFMFSMDDPASIVSLSDAKTQYHIKSFERQLDQWRRHAKFDITKPWVRHIEATVNLYIHEIAIHFDHNIDDFRPPPNMTAAETHNLEQDITPAHIDAFITCMENIHQTFDSFFEMDIKTLRNLPNLFFVRNAYAAVALIKMDGVIHAKGSKFGSILAPDLKVAHYLDNLIKVHEQVAEGGMSSVAMAFQFVMKKLRGWYLQRRDLSFPGTMGKLYDIPNCASMCLSMTNEEMPSEQVSDPSSVPALARSTAYAQSVKEEVGSAATRPTTVFEGSDQSWAANHLGYSFAPGQGYSPDISDTTMFNIGLPQFYDFGFTFDDMGSTNTSSQDLGWMGFSM